MQENMFENIIAVTNRKLCAIPIEEQMEIVCRKHPRAVIVREKDLGAEEYGVLAGEIAQICERHEVMCIYHTYWEIAQRAGRNAIHFPMHMLAEWSSEGRSGDFECVGASVHSVQEAVLAEQLGATYLTAGHIYQTDCKKDLPPRGIEFLREVCSHVTIPVYAIGGIHIDNVQLAEVRSCSAAGACVMSDMMRLQD